MKRISFQIKMDKLVAMEAKRLLGELAKAHREANRDQKRKTAKSKAATKIAALAIIIFHEAFLIVGSLL